MPRARRRRVHHRILGSVAALRGLPRVPRTPSDSYQRRAEPPHTERSRRGKLRSPSRKMKPKAYRCAALERAPPTPRSLLGFDGARNRQPTRCFRACLLLFAPSVDLLPDPSLTRTIRSSPSRASGRVPASSRCNGRRHPPACLIRRTRRRRRAPGMRPHRGPSWRGTARGRAPTRAPSLAAPRR